MSATVHSPSAAHVPFHGKAALVLAVLAAVGVLAEAGAPLTGVTKTVAVSAPKTVRAVRPVLDEPVAAQASAADWSKTPASVDPSAAAIAAYDL